MIDRSKDGDKEKTFDGRERLTARCSRVPNADQQMVHCHGYDSNVCRRQRKKANEDGLVSCLLRPDEPSQGYCENWARLIQWIGPSAIDFNNLSICAGTRGGIEAYEIGGRYVCPA